MKKYIILAALFISPILISSLFLEYRLRELPNDYCLKNNYLQSHASEIETLILGSSHSYYGINPIYFDSKTFNASYVSQSLDYDYKIFMKFKHDFKSLNTVVLPISYFSYWYQVKNSIESWRCKDYAIYYKIPTINIKYNSEVLTNPLKKNLQLVKYQSKKSFGRITCSELGWGKKYSSKHAKDVLKVGKGAAIKHTQKDINSKFCKKTYRKNVKYTRKIIDWCQDNNIDVILITLPAFDTYRRELNGIQLLTTINTSCKIDSTFDNCSYFNMIADSSFVVEDYYDSDHLSEIGAKKISLKLNNIIKQNQK